MPKAGPKRYQAKDYVNLFKLGYSYKQIAAKLDVEYDAVKSAMYRWRKKHVDKILVPEIVHSYENTSAETERWTNTLNRLSKRDRFLRVCHVNDLHFPYYDVDAFAMTCEAMAQFNPHIIVVGSDAMDYPTLSRYDPDPRIKLVDYMSQTEYYWHLMIEKIRVACDEAVLVYVAGNHDLRALKHINATMSSEWLMDGLMDTLRLKGQVIWLGATDRVHIGNLTVMHGEYATVHTAKKYLDWYKHQENIMAGHTHRPDFYTVRGRKESVKVAISGCNCSLTPHYQYLKQCSDWQHGTTLATIDMIGGQCHFDNLVYNHEADHLWTVAQGQVMQVKKQQAMEKVA